MSKEQQQQEQDQEGIRYVTLTGPQGQELRNVQVARDGDDLLVRIGGLSTCDLRGFQVGKEKTPWVELASSRLHPRSPGCPITLGNRTFSLTLNLTSRRVAEDALRVKEEAAGGQVDATPMAL